MHPWTAGLVTRNTPGGLDTEHEQALAMRLRRFEQERGTYEDLVDIPRHLAALGRYDEAAAIARHAAGMLPGTLAVVAYLAEVRPLIPETERAWALVAEQEFYALVQAGDLGSATGLLRPGTWPPPGPPTRPPWSSPSGWPLSTRPTPAGSAT
jgi:hypothetical protein